MLSGTRKPPLFRPRSAQRLRAPQEQLAASCHYRAGPGEAISRFSSTHAALTASGRGRRQIPLSFFLRLLSALLLLGAAPAEVRAQLLFTTNNGAITITGYNGPGGAVTIPATTNGRPVVSIANSAFSVFSGTPVITSIIIPDSVTNIGAGAFYQCNTLTNATIGSGITGIGNAAFYGCTALTTFSMGNSHAGLPDMMFANCGNLSQVTLPASISSIGTSAFYQCTHLTNAPLGTNLTSVGNSAFSYCSGLPGVTIPNSVASIGDAAFYQCTGLKNLVIPNNVISIGGDAFYSCTGLTNATFGTNLASIGIYAFWGCTGLTSLVIPNSVTDLGDYAFYQCSGVTNLSISTRLTSIGNWVFTYCNPTTATIPAGVTNIGDYALGGWYFASAIFFAGNAPTSQGLGIFQGDPATVYYLPGTTNWGTSFGGLPTVLWNPQAQTRDGSFGVLTNRFGFNITGTPGIPVVVEAATNLDRGRWTLLQNCTLINGSIYFSDSQWRNYPARFYRLRSP